MGFMINVKRLFQRRSFNTFEKSIISSGKYIVSQITYKNFPKNSLEERLR